MRIRKKEKLSRWKMMSKLTDKMVQTKLGENE